jgi:hypothetical protein
LYNGDAHVSASQNLTLASFTTHAALALESHLERC